MIQNVTLTEFASMVLGSNRPVLVDFWADWCGPCKALAPMLEDLAEDYDGQVSVAKVDIVADEALANQYSVKSIPLLLLFKNGAVVETVVGITSRARLAALLDKHL